MIERERILSQLKRAVALKQAGGTATVVMYRHDDGCPTLETNRGADCQCDPDVEVIPVDLEEGGGSRDEDGGRRGKAEHDRP